MVIEYMASSMGTQFHMKVGHRNTALQKWVFDVMYFPLETQFLCFM